MKLTYGTRRVLLFTGMAVVCIGVIALVEYQQVSADNMTDMSSSSKPSEIVMGTLHDISVPPISSESGTSSTFVPSSGAETSAPLTEVSKPSSTPPKPTPPPSSALTNKNKKPTYSSKPTASKAPTKKIKSTAGYNDPVFGNKVGTGGETIIDKKTDQDGDINKQVGTMD